jgi:hypothetical protein
MRSTQEQIRAIYALLGKHKLRDEKESIVAGFTAGRTKSVRAMSFQEAKALISHLKSMDPQDNSITKMRNKIISMAHEMVWRLPDGKIDIDHVNAWCIKSGYLKKKLDDYTYSELPKLVSQFEEVYNSYLKAL